MRQIVEYIPALKLAGFDVYGLGRGWEWEWGHLGRGLVSTEYYSNAEDAWESARLYVRGAKYEEFNAVPWSEE